MHVYRQKMDFDIPQLEKDLDTPQDKKLIGKIKVNTHKFPKLTNQFHPANPNTKVRSKRRFIKRRRKTEHDEFFQSIGLRKNSYRSDDRRRQQIYSKGDLSQRSQNASISGLSMPVPLPDLHQKNSSKLISTIAKIESQKMNASLKRKNFIKSYKIQHPSYRYP